MRLQPGTGRQMWRLGLGRYCAVACTSLMGSSRLSDPTRPASRALSSVGALPVTKASASASRVGLAFTPNTAMHTSLAHPAVEAQRYRRAGQRVIPVSTGHLLEGPAGSRLQDGEANLGQDFCRADVGG